MFYVMRSIQADLALNLDVIDITTEKILSKTMMSKSFLLRSDSICFLIFAFTNLDTLYDLLLNK